MKKFKELFEANRYGPLDHDDMVSLDKIRDYHWRLGRYHELDGNTENFHKHNEIGQILDSIISFHKGNKGKIPEYLLPKIEDVP
jgi:hypothetical protein